MANPPKQAAAPSGGSKNNPAARVVSNNQKTTEDGKPIVAVLYAGRQIGHGKYMAGQVDGNLIVDSAGRPIPYRSL